MKKVKLIASEVPGVPMETLDLGLRGRLFKDWHGYQVTATTCPVVHGHQFRDLDQSAKRTTLEPALPIYTIDKPERYPLEENLARELFGLKRRLSCSRPARLSSFTATTCPGAPGRSFRAT